MSERITTPARRRLRRVALAAAVVVVGALLAPGSASALPVGAPRIGMVCTPGTVAAGTHTFNLVAKTGYIDTPDGNSIFMWSYADEDAPDNGRFQSPGPVLCVTEGETVVVHLTNQLSEASSAVFPGQTGVTATGGSVGLLTTEAAASGGAVSYSFVAGSAGTYVYESGSDTAKQIEMGLYGALVVRPGLGPNYAYGDASTQFDPSREFLLLLAEIDPDLHHAVEVGGAYDYNSLRNRYFTINGRSFPDTILDNSSTLLPNQPYGALVRIQPDQGSSAPALLRMINAGVLNHPFHPHGNHTVEIAKDGRLLLSTPGGLPATSQHFGETVGSGETEDFLLHWTDTDNFNPVTKPYPVTPPNYKNVTFKDANTWYSGSPYLGYKGTLPTGVTSQNICGEWYFPMHSHALNEFANFDSGFGGMGTLLRVDPPGGCFAYPASATIVRGALKGGSVTGMGADDASYYQVNPKTTTRSASSMTAGQTSMSVTTTAGFPTTPGFFVRVQSEDMQVTALNGNTWTVLRGQLGTTAATHANSTAGRAVSALANDWYVKFGGVLTGAANLKVTYKGRNCANTTGNGCTGITTANLPQQTVRICDWTVSGPAGCSTATSNGWVTLAGPPTQPGSVGSVDVPSTWTISGSAAAYIGTGANTGQIRVMVQTQWWTPGGSPPPPQVPTAFSTQANLLAIQYDAP